MLAEDWLEVLRKEVDRTTQAAVARRLNLSPTTISLVLKGKYEASTERIEARVRTELMAETIECPVLGVITRKFCQEWQDKARREVGPASALHQEVYATCRGGCPHSSIKEFL